MKKLHTFVVLAYKESEYLEECIKSTLNQKYKSDVIIATSTPNKFITDLANKYSLKVYENKGPKGIGNDFDFGIKCASTPLVTIAHQDDIYDYEFSYYVVEEYNEHKGVIILFTDYYEIRNDFKQYINRNLIIKRILLTPIRLHSTSGLKINKRLILALGNSICCPSVTFNVNKIKFPVFASDFKCDVDWCAWERLSKLPGKFVFISKNLMGHRIHSDSTTTEIIQNNARTTEDLVMFEKFWPSFIAKHINNFYSKSENNNKVDKV